MSKPTEDAVAERQRNAELTERLKHSEYWLSQSHGGIMNELNYWKVKATCYGNMVHGCNPVLESAGYPVDRSLPEGAVGGVAKAVIGLAGERDALKAENDRLAERVNILKSAMKLMATDYSDGSIGKHDPELVKEACEHFIKLAVDEQAGKDDQRAGGEVEG